MPRKQEMEQKDELVHKSSAAATYAYNYITSLDSPKMSEFFQTLVPLFFRCRLGVQSARFGTNRKWIN